jgi:glycosyltransferase involved in cell wall biosynthesis
MNQSGYNILNDMNIKSDILVINQCDEESSLTLSPLDRTADLSEISKSVLAVSAIREGHSTSWINTRERGLSKSRNMALRNAAADICLLADDDLVYIDGYADTIVRSFEAHPEIDIMAFQVIGIEKTFKTYSPNDKKLNYLSSMRVSTVQIAFRLASIRQKNISFNEMFGSGSIYSSGEENIFLFDCLKKGLRILYKAVKIADLHMGNSSWFHGYNEKYFISKGAAYHAMSGLWSYILILQFALRHYKAYKRKCRLIDSITLMLRGKREYKRATNPKL